MGKRIFINASSSLLTLLLFFLPNTVEATTHIQAGSPRMVLVLDASGSMWGQIEGTAKITIAKEVLSGLIDEIPANFHTGLSVYGHRRKGDCSDIEMVLPVKQHNPAAMKAKIAEINPKGKTPLSEAVRQAATALRYVEERATVVLVSDGLETCDVDPCALAAELAQTGIDFTIHVIGFDISKEDQGRLRCMADKTGGLFLAAEDAGSLRKALQTTVSKVKEPPPPVVEEPRTATLKAPDSVAIGSVFKIQWEGPDSRGDQIGIAPKVPQDANTIDRVYTKSGNPVDFVAPAKKGAYELRYIHNHSGKVIGKRNIDITPIPATVKVPKSASVASTFEAQWTGPGYQSDYISVAKADQTPASYIDYKYIREGSSVTLRAPSEPGSYEVRYVLGRGDEILTFTAIDITPVEASVQAPESAEAASEFEVLWQGPGNAEDWISVARSDQGAGSYLHYKYTRDGSPLKLRAPSDPGTYEVRYILGRGEKLLAQTTINVTGVTASLKVPESADAASEFAVVWQGPDSKGDWISIAHPDQGNGSYLNYKYTRGGNPLKLRAPADPGTYEVRYILGQGEKLLAMTTITINEVTASLQTVTAADMASQFEVSWQGPANKGDWISVARPNQKPDSYINYQYIKNENPLKIWAPSEPGTYEVRYILGQSKKLLAMTTITINEVTATLQPPQSAAAGAEVQVIWTGPGYSGDYISIARPDQKPRRYVSYNYIKKGNPLTIRAPKDPGLYEVRYILARGNKLLSKVPIIID